MKALIKHDVPRGRDQGSMIILLFENSGLIVHLSYAAQEIKFGDPTTGKAWLSGIPTEKDGFSEIKLKEDLVILLSGHFASGDEISQRVISRIQKIVSKHKNAHRQSVAPDLKCSTSTQQTLEQIRTLDT